MTHICFTFDLGFVYNHRLQSMTSDNGKQIQKEIQYSSVSHFKLLLCCQNIHHHSIYDFKKSQHIYPDFRKYIAGGGLSFSMCNIANSISCIQLFPMYQFCTLLLITLVLHTAILWFCISWPLRSGAVQVSHDHFQPSAN